MATDVLIREMTATLPEFRHGLSMAFPVGVSEHEHGFLVTDGETTLEIKLESLPPRIIALLQLPRLKVTLRFTRGDPAQKAALLARMDLAMQRGGG
jgi:hypothetical protein